MKSGTGNFQSGCTEKMHLHSFLYCSSNAELCHLCPWSNAKA